MSKIDEIKKALKDKKLVIGTNSVNKGLKRDNLKSVFYASNCPADAMGNLNHYNKLTNVGLENFDGNSIQLAEICGKPFNILMVGIKK